MLEGRDAARSLGLWQATGIGVGAIVGGGILALAGVAFATTGPSAVLAFALNGVIALLTAWSFGELAARFPQSGGTYAYARRTLPIEAAFAVGWVVWFASVVAAVLYAMGFAVFFVPLLEQLVRATGGVPPAWLGGRFALLAYALAAVGAYAWQIMRADGGGGQWATIGKVVVFALLIVGGVWAFLTDLPTTETLGQRFAPFLEAGATGLVQAMGYTFIALQGFDLIAAVGGEVRDPERNIPRAMFLSLGAALAIYIPLLLLIVAVGSPDQPVAALAAEDPEILVAAAARGFLGAGGYWLVVVAGILSMLSALQANLMAAAAFARTMATDRTLPPALAGSGGGDRGPSVKVSAGMIALVLVAVPNVAGAGAASSLIFLVTFTLVHCIAYLARRRARSASPFETPAFPVVPWAGGGACLALGLYQALAVPSAGVLAALWLSCGAVLYMTYLAPRARAVDAGSEGFDPQLVQLRGRAPVVLVPIARPQSATTLVQLAEAIAPEGAFRIRLLTVVRVEQDAEPEARLAAVRDAEKIVSDSLSTSLALGLRPETTVTLSADPWSEIERIAVASRCETLVLGVGALGGPRMVRPVEELMARISADVVVVRAPLGWDPRQARRLLIPTRLGRAQSPIRARLLGSLSRTARREATFLAVVPESTPEAGARRAGRVLRRLVMDEAPGFGEGVVIRSDDLVGEVARRAEESDLLILGLQRVHRRQGVFGQQILDLAAATKCPLLLISRRTNPVPPWLASPLARAGEGVRLR